MPACFACRFQGRTALASCEETAMKLYNLEHLELIRDPLTSTKCLVAWGQDTIVVAFRGTANRQNAAHDMKVSRPMPCPALSAYQPEGKTPFCSQFAAQAIGRMLPTQVQHTVTASVYSYVSMLLSAGDVQKIVSCTCTCMCAVYHCCVWMLSIHVVRAQNSIVCASPLSTLSVVTGVALHIGLAGATFAR